MLYVAITIYQPPSYTRIVQEVVSEVSNSTRALQYIYIYMYIYMDYYFFHIFNGSYSMLLVFRNELW